MTSRRLSLRRSAPEEPAAPAPVALDKRPDRARPAARGAAAADEAGRVRAGGKGRPTPKRNAARGPVAPPPQTRKEAAQRLREQQARERKGLRSGDTMLPRDAGPIRAAVRDIVDSRRNAAALMLPVALLYVVASPLSAAIGNDRPISVMTRIFTIMVLLVIADTIILALMVRSRVQADFPEERARRHAGYALLRSSVYRRWRMPPARVRPAPLVRR